MNVVKTGSSAAEHKIRPFLKDVEPFFYKAPVIYVDVGAYSGAVFREMFQAAAEADARLSRRAEPRLLRQLKETVEPGSRPDGSPPATTSRSAPRPARCGCARRTR